METYLNRKLQELKKLTHEELNEPYSEQSGIAGKISTLINEVEDTLMKYYGVKNSGALAYTNAESYTNADFEKHEKFRKKMLPFENIKHEYDDKILKKINMEGQARGWDNGIMQEQDPEKLAEIISEWEKKLIMSDIAEPEKKKVIQVQLELAKHRHRQLLDKIANANYSQEEYKQISKEIETAFDNFNKKAYLLLHPDNWSEETGNNFVEWTTEVEHTITEYLKKYHSHTTITSKIKTRIELLDKGIENLVDVVMGKKKPEKSIKVISEPVKLKLMIDYSHFRKFLSDMVDNLNNHAKQLTEKPQPKKPLPKGTKNESQPKTFDELFYDMNLISPCIEVLGKVTPALIDKDCNYIGKSKGAFCIWMDEMQKQGIIKHYSDRKIYSDLLCKKIKRFSIDESMFGKPYGKRAEDTYRTDFKTLLSQIKLSQNSQKGKLGK